jgi:hypothetical protein
MPGRQMIYDITNQRFGRLLVLTKSNKKMMSGHYLWECLCDCGNRHFAKADHLRAGGVRSCGCLHKEELTKAMTKHGFSGQPIHNNWMGMIDRCTNPNSHAWKNYGGRGINVSPEWMDFETFYRDMGEKPKGTSLDRVDVNGNYSKENCKWSTFKAQARNTRRNLIIEFNGEIHVLAEWCEVLGLNYMKTYHKLKKGLSLELVLGGGASK